MSEVPVSPATEANPFAASPLKADSAAPATATGDATGGVIPYKNPAALIAYYCGLFSLLPVLGFFLGCISLVLGIMGLRAKARKPEIKGSVHAWIGIIFGSVAIVVWGGVILLIIGGIASGY